MPRPRKQPAGHEDLSTAIMDAAWQQMDEDGVASLSLRAIARALHITAPAIYNYYPSRDDLVTALVAEAFNSFADALEAGRDSAAPEDHAARYHALGHAYRDWALAHPQHYRLIFGTPIPGYDFPVEVSLVSARSFFVLLEVIGDAYAAGALQPPPGYIRITPSMKEQLDQLAAMGHTPEPEVYYLAMETWAMIHGLVSLELYGHLGGFLGGSADSFVDAEIEGRMLVYGLVPAAER